MQERVLNGVIWKCKIYRCGWSAYLFSGVKLTECYTTPLPTPLRGVKMDARQGSRGNYVMLPTAVQFTRVTVNDIRLSAFPPRKIMQTSLYLLVETSKYLRWVRVWLVWTYRVFESSTRQLPWIILNRRFNSLSKMSNFTPKYTVKNSKVLNCTFEISKYILCANFVRVLSLFLGQKPAKVSLHNLVAGVRISRRIFLTFAQNYFKFTIRIYCSERSLFG